MDFGELQYIIRQHNDDGYSFNKIKLHSDDYYSLISDVIDFNYLKDIDKQNAMTFVGLFVEKCDDVVSGTVIILSDNNISITKKLFTEDETIIKNIIE
jgi:hypothetical protein